MEIPTGGRGRITGSSWKSPEQTLLEREAKEKEDNAKASPFEEFINEEKTATVFRQTPYRESTHKKAFAYIELYSGKVEKVIIYFFKQATCNEFCDLVRRQILNGVFKQYELDLFLADDEGNFDDKNQPPPSNEILAKIINLGLDSFYFKIANSWQLSATDKAKLVKTINDHKYGLSVIKESNNAVADSDDSDDSDDDDNDNEQAKMSPKTEKQKDDNGDEEITVNAKNGCCIIL